MRWFRSKMALTMGCKSMAGAPAPGCDPGCGPEKTVGDQQMDLAQKLEDQAQEAVDQLNKQNPDALLDIKGE